MKARSSAEGVSDDQFLQPARTDRKPATKCGKFIHIACNEASVPPAMQLFPGRWNQLSLDGQIAMKPPLRIQVLTQRQRQHLPTLGDWCLDDPESRTNSTSAGITSTQYFSRS